VTNWRSRAASTLALLAGIAALVATVGFVNDVVRKSFTVSPVRPSATAPPPAQSTSTVTKSNSLYPSDNQGFINSSARCEGALIGAAFARTEGSLVTICSDQKGNYQYRAVRLSDGAALSLPAESTGPSKFVASNEGVTYSLSTAELVITAGDTVVRDEPVIDYREPGSR
jgi:hypothetical protein